MYFPWYEVENASTEQPAVTLVKSGEVQFQNRIADKNFALNQTASFQTLGSYQRIGFQRDGLSHHAGED